MSTKLEATLLMSSKLEGCLYELASACCSAGQKISTFVRAICSLLSELKAFSASINSMASVSDFSNSLLKLWIAYSVSHFWTKQNWRFLRYFQGLILYIA